MYNICTGLKGKKNIWRRLDNRECIPSDDYGRDNNKEDIRNKSSYFDIPHLISDDLKRGGNISISKRGGKVILSYVLYI